MTVADKPGAVGPQGGARPIVPQPDVHSIGPYKAQGWGVVTQMSKVTSNGEGIVLNFSGKAHSGGDLAAALELTLPNNYMLPSNPPPPATITVKVSFDNGDSAKECAKKLEAALVKQAPSYHATVSGGKVTIIQNLMTPRVDG
jgi:hypothetical protein